MIEFSLFGGILVFYHIVFTRILPKLLKVL